MTRRTDFEKKEPLSLREFSLKCSETLDKGVDAYKSINHLNDSAIAVQIPQAGEIHSALDEMESVIVHLASAKVGGDINRTREELESRGLKDIL